MNLYDYHMEPKQLLWHDEIRRTSGFLIYTIDEMLHRIDVEGATDNDIFDDSTKYYDMVTALMTLSKMELDDEGLRYVLGMINWLDDVVSYVLGGDIKEEAELIMDKIKHNVGKAAEK